MIWYGLKFLPRSDPVEEGEANAFQVLNMENSMTIGQLTISTNGPFFLIAGPCVIEAEATMLQVADFLRETSEKLGIPTIFKSSYDKANRTSMDSFRGPGVEEGLEILQKVKERTGLPVLSDVHRISEVERAAGVLDVIQIPAFLCRSISRKASLSPLMRSARSSRRRLSPETGVSSSPKGGLFSAITTWWWTCGPSP